MTGALSSMTTREPSTPRRLSGAAWIPMGSRNRPQGPGTPLDNAVAESFFKTLKRELVKDRGCKTREEAKQDIFKYIELYYNAVRMHSTLGYVSPVEYERRCA